MGNPAASGIPDGAVIDMGYATWHSDFVVALVRGDYE
jgi:hypothetical protein